MPKDITQGPCSAPFVDTVDLPGYHVPGRPDAALLRKTASLMAKSRKPVLYVGHGAVISNASEAIVQLALDVVRRQPSHVLLRGHNRVLVGSAGQSTRATR